MKIVRLKVKSNIYAEDSTGKEMLVKKGVIKTLSIDIDSIQVITDSFSVRGEKLKTFCDVYVENIGFIKVNHSREFIEGLKDHITIKGFRRT